MTSLQETYVAVKGIIADNLESMGVEASSSDGLTTLAGKILDIEPSVSGLDLDTALTLSASSSTVTVNDSITLTATLTASYDDETLVNVDLSGVLQNATIKFYEGSTLKGTATTNSSGVATYTYTPTTGGNKTLKAVFDGTENFQDAESSSVSITVNKIASTISLSASANSIVVGTTLTLSGVLKDSNNEFITNASVKLYNGNNLLDTVTTDSVGAFSKSVSGLNVGSYSFTAVFEGDSIYTNVTSTAVSVTVNKITSTISLSTSSSSVIVGNTFTLSGTLSVGSGCSVKLYEDETLIDTLTTESGGTFSKTITASTTGSYDYWVKYEGDSTHTQVMSSDVTVTVSSKIVPNISLSAASSTVTVGNNVVLSGTLTAGANKSVKIYQGASLIDTVNTDGLGQFGKSVTGLSVGDYSFTAVFEGDSTYASVTSSAVSVSVVAPVPDSISLTSNKSILSYADSESATLSATVLDANNDPIEGETVTFYNGSTSMGTATTNSSGVATKTYASAGAGDVSFTAQVGIIVSETYSIHDYILVDAMTTNSGHWSYGTALTHTHSSSGTTVSSNSWSNNHMDLDTLINAPHSIEWTVTSIASTQYMNYDNSGVDPLFYFQADGRATLNGTHYYGKGGTGHYLFKVYSDSLEFYKDGNFVASMSIALLNKTFVFSMGTNARMTLKDVIIKPL